jgi:hypothetical protein
MRLSRPRSKPLVERRSSNGKALATQSCRQWHPTPLSLCWVPRPRLCVGVSSNVKRIRTPTQSRGRGTPPGTLSVFLAEKTVNGVEWHPRDIHSFDVDGLLVRHVVRIKRAWSADRRAGRCNHRTAHRDAWTAHRGARRRCVVRATGRHSEESLRILSAPWLGSLLQEARRTGSRIWANTCFRKWIVNIERSFIGVVLRRHEVRQPCPLAALGREKQAQNPRHDAANGGMVGVQKTDASGVHVSILRDGILRDGRPRRSREACACGRSSPPVSSRWRDSTGAIRPRTDRFGAAGKGESGILDFRFWILD